MLTSTLRGIVATGTCSTTGDPEAWFPEKAPTREQAAALCDGCPVRLPCLLLALRTEQQSGNRTFGIWGGTTEKTRRRLVEIRNRRAARAAELAELVDEQAVTEAEEIAA